MREEILELINDYSSFYGGELVRTFLFQENVTGEGNEITVRIYQIDENNFYATANNQIQNKYGSSEREAIQLLLIQLNQENFSIK
jgi:hypothetical protein